MGPKPACFGAFSTTFRFPKSELPSTYGHVHFGESEPNVRKIGNAHQDTKMYIFRRKYILSPRKKNMCFISEKYTQKRENW